MPIEKQSELYKNTTFRNSEPVRRPEPKDEQSDYASSPESLASAVVDSQVVVVMLTEPSDGYYSGSPNFPPEVFGAD